MQPERALRLGAAVEASLVTARGRAVLVVPCYDEERRLDVQAFTAFAKSGRALLQFVNDGSRDGTARVLEQMQSAVPAAVRVLSLTRNQGKAEAVRQGLLEALRGEPAFVGYVDADLSAPLSEIERLLDVAEAGRASVIMGSRVGLLGTHIERSRARHYLGRVFATAASLILALPVYDTQCGAKVFRATGALRAALSAPFISAWGFDVELLGRLLVGGPAAPALSAEEFVEVPLQHWRDVRGSRLSSLDMLHAGLELGLIARALRERRRLAVVASG